METSSETGVLLSPDVSSISARSKAKQEKTVKKDLPAEVDIDAKTFEEAEASIKALVEETEPKPVTVKVNKEKPVELNTNRTNGEVESSDSFSEFVYLTSDHEDDDDIAEAKETEDEVDPEFVLDKIFDAATSGNSEHFSRLLFNQKSKKQADCVQDLDVRNKEKVKETTSYKPIVDQLLDKNRIRRSSRKRKIENNKIASGEKIFIKTTSGSKKQKSIDFKDIKNTNLISPKLESQVTKSDPNLNFETEPEQNINPDVPKVSLIDYSVLTNALTKTLQDNLNGGENDVKIVIFCNNKPIQSFSLKNNLGEVAAANNLDTDPPPADAELHSSQVSSKVSKNLNIITGEAVGLNVAHDSSGRLQNNQQGFPKINKESDFQNLAGETSSHKVAGDVKSDSSARIVPTKLIVCKDLKSKQEKRKGGISLLPSRKKVDTSTFLRIRGTSVSKVKDSEKKKEQPRDKDSDSDDDGHKLVINTAETHKASEKVASDSGVPIVIPRFQCEFCEKNFSLRRTLNRHKLRFHTGPFPLPTNSVRYNRIPIAPSAPGSSETEVLVGLNESDNNTANENILNVTVEGDETNSGNEQNELNIDITQVKTEASVEEVDISKINSETGQNSEHDIDYIQSLLSKGPLYDILQSKNTAQVTKVNTLRSVIQSVEKSKKLELPIDANGEIQPVFVCEHCGKYYRARKTLKDHFLREHAKELGEEPLYLYIAGNKYQCTICFHYFHSASELLSHTKTHTGELRSPCSICGKVYASVHVLRRHIDNVHSEVRPRPFRCQLCDYAASNKWHLKEHHRRHTGEQPFCCPICKKSFSHQGTMNRHCKSIHRFDSSSLSREQLRLQQGLSNITVPSLELARTGISLVDITSPQETPELTPDASINDFDPSIVKTEPLSPEKDVETEEVDTSIVKTEPMVEEDD